MSKKRRLATVEEVIEGLGGVAVVAELIGRSRENVMMMRARSRFAAPTFLVMRAALRRKRLSAPVELWGIERPHREAA